MSNDEMADRIQEFFEQVVQIFVQRLDTEDEKLEKYVYYSIPKND